MEGTEGTIEGAVEAAEGLDPSSLDDFSGDVWSLDRTDWEITDTDVIFSDSEGNKVDSLSEAARVSEVITFETEHEGREIKLVLRFWKLFPSNPAHTPPEIVQNIGRSQLALLRTAALGRKLAKGESIPVETLEGRFVSAVGRTDKQGQRELRYFQASKLNTPSAAPETVSETAASVEGI